jgi:hypothetical protein
MAHSAARWELEASGPGALVPSSSSRLTHLLTGRPSASRGSDTPWLTTPGVLFVAFVFAACTGAAASSIPSSAALSDPVVTAELTAGATSSTTASPAPGVTASAATQGRHADPELEALLPSTLGGVALTVESQAGTDLATQSAAFDAFLASLGKTRAEFSLASAYSPGGLEAAVGAWRVKGADPALLLPGFRTAVQASSTTPLAQVGEIVAGRAVTRIGDPGQLTQGPLYVFVLRDTLWFVQTTEPALAEEAMAKLPQ